MGTPTCVYTVSCFLSDIEKQILEYIYKKRLPTGICYVSYKLLSKELCISKKSLHKAIQSLIRKGFIKRERKGYYSLRDKAILYLETIEEAGISNTTLPPHPPTPSPLTFLLSGLIGFEILNEWSKKCFLFYRPHNIRIRIPLLSLHSSLACKGTIDSPFGRIHIIIPKDFDKSPYLLIEVIDYTLIKNDRFGDVVNYISSLPYKIATWLSRRYKLSIDYDNIVITHSALGIIINPKEVPEDVINKLTSVLMYQDINAKKSLFVVDESVSYPEIEIESDDVNKIYEVLVLMFPLTLLEFIKKDMEIDVQILNELKEIKEMLKK